MDTTQIGHRIRHLRHQKDYSQEWMAGKLKISQTAYSRLESGVVEKVNPDIYCAIAEILETDIASLLSPESGPTFNNYNQQNCEIGIIHKYNANTDSFLKIIAAQMEALQQQIALLNTLLQNNENNSK